MMAYGGQPRSSRRRTGSANDKVARADDGGITVENGPLAIPPRRERCSRLDYVPVYHSANSGCRPWHEGRSRGSSRDVDTENGAPGIRRKSSSTPTRNYGCRPEGDIRSPTRILRSQLQVPDTDRVSWPVPVPAWNAA